MEWPDFRERFARFREAIELIRRLWSEERVSFDGEFYKTRQATIYDAPPGGRPPLRRRRGAPGGPLRRAGRRRPDLHKRQRRRPLPGAAPAGLRRGGPQGRARPRPPRPPDRGQGLLRPRPGSGPWPTPATGAPWPSPPRRRRASKTPWRWSAWRTPCRWSAPPAGGSSPSDPEEHAAKGAGVRRTGLHPPRLPRPRARPAALPRPLRGADPAPPAPAIAPAQAARGRSSREPSRGT